MVLMCLPSLGDSLTMSSDMVLRRGLGALSLVSVAELLSSMLIGVGY